MSTTFAKTVIETRKRCGKMAALTLVAIVSVSDAATDSVTRSQAELAKAADRSPRSFSRDKHELRKRNIVIVTRNHDPKTGWRMADTYTVITDRRSWSIELLHELIDQEARHKAREKAKTERREAHRTPNGHFGPCKLNTPDLQQSSLISERLLQSRIVSGRS